MNRSLRAAVFAILVLTPLCALAGPDYFCIECHSAAEMGETGDVLSYRASVYQEDNTPCRALRELKREVFFTENRLLRTDLALRAFGRRHDLVGELSRESMEFKEATSRAVHSAGQVTRRLGGIRADLHGVYMELNRERDGARARRAVGAAVLLVAALSLMAAVRLRGAGRRGGLMKMLAAFALAGALAASCMAPLPETGRARQDMEAVVERAEEMAGRAEALAVRAWALGKIAIQGRREAAPLLEEALRTAREIRKEEYLNYAQALRLKSQGWPPEMEQRADEAALRLERASSRVWPLRAVAGELRGLNRGRAMRLLEEAASEARKIGDRELRDIELRGIASEMAVMNPALAVQTASLIEAPYYRAWALLAVGGAAGDLKVLRRALLEAGKVGPDGREKGGKRARLLHQKALLMAKTAVAMDRAGAARDSTLDAVDMAVLAAESIDTPRGRAYAYSSLASLLAPVDVPTAAYIASRIGQGYPEASSSARTSIAIEMARRDEGAALAELASVFDIAGEMEDLYDRQKTLGRAAHIMGGIDPDEAIARMSGPEGRPLMELPIVLAEALGPALLRKPPEDAERLLEGEGPFLRAELYAALAERWMGQDRARGEGYFRKALSAAEEARSPYLGWMAAFSWARHDPEKLYEAMPGLGEPDPYFSAAASLGLALDLQGAENRAGALRAFGLALREAMRIEEPYLRSEALREIARHAGKADGDISLRAFEAALAAARELGALGGTR